MLSFSIPASLGDSLTKEERRKFIYTPSHLSSDELRRLGVRLLQNEPKGVKERLKAHRDKPKHVREREQWEGAKAFSVHNTLHNLNLSYVGKVGKIKNGFFIPAKEIAIYSRLNRFGRGYVGVKYQGRNIQNLRKGGRKSLRRTNLTAHAKRMIQGAGDFFEWYSNEYGKSPVLLTLTYGRNVPDDSTAKKHLQNLIRNLKRYGYFKWYAWVAQLQTGERAKKKGVYSYRAEHGAAIHFHILTTSIPISLLRKHWCRIVNKWEAKEGNEPTRLGGVDIRAVYNASNYVSKYISEENKSGNILGNLWNVSKELRDEIRIHDTDPLITNNFEWSDFIKATKAGNKDYEVRDRTYLNTVKACNDWDGNGIIFSKDCRIIMREFVKYQRRKQQLNYRQVLLN